MIKTTSIPRSKLPFFSKEDIDLIYHQDKLSQFIGLPFAIENFEKQIKTKKKLFTTQQRNTIARVLDDNYKKLSGNELALKQISLLKEENTYTVTTGHQLCLYGGPLYFFIKIIHTIRLSEVLKEHYPDYNFVPIFWMASEDHDSDEIKSLYLFGKNVTWNHEQNGAVGKFNTQRLTEVKDQLLALFRSQKGSELDKYLSAMEGNTYGDAFQSWIHYLFGDMGLLVVDADHQELKKQMIPILKKEIFENFSNECIEKTNQKLRQEKRTPQVHSRKINVFYMGEGKRERIIEDKDGIYKAGEISFSKNKLMTELNKRPNLFSPNVALRPILQELLLPNVCYIGGMAELKYWTQLKSVFETCNIPFPILKLRSNLLWIDKNAHKRLIELGLTMEDLFEQTELLQKMYISKSDTNPVDTEKVSMALEIIEKTYIESLEKNQGLKSWLGAELKKIKRQHKSIQQKIEKTKKSNFDGQLKKVAKLKENLFPNQKLQERTLNLLHFCNSGTPKERLQELYHAIDPLTNDFTVLIENQTK
tara:strand:- start:2368 stop:3966 length:1599 start_codon:yes stop_codon:yes gene_type:complete